MASFKRSLFPGSAGIVAIILLLRAFATSSSQLLLFISLLSTLLFLGIGALVWLFAHDRKIAWLLGGCCFALAFTFSTEPQAVANDPFASAWTTAGSAAALLFLSLILLFFPHNLRWSYYKIALICFICLVGSGAIIYAIPLWLPFLWPFSPLPKWTNDLDYLYYFFFTSADCLYLFFLFVLSSRFSDKHIRQQIRMIFWGYIAFLPFLLGTLLPSLIAPTLTIPGEITTAFFWIFPLALAYALLRYEVIVLDHRARRACHWITYAILAPICIYLLYHATSTIANFFIHMGLWIIGSCLCAVLAWRGSARLIDGLFFQEYKAALQHMEAPETLKGGLVDIVDMLLSAAEQFLAPSCCLFLLDEQLDHYIPFLRSSAERQAFLERLQQLIFQVGAGETISSEHELIQRLALSRARRPLLWRELVVSKGMQKLTTSNRLEDRIMLAPLRKQRKLIGLLLCARLHPGDYGYAGPDLEMAQVIVQRFASRLETARITWQAGKHDQLLEELLRLPDAVDASFTQVATNITTTVAKATLAHAEIWWLDPDQQIQRIAAAGEGPDLPNLTRAHIEQAKGPAIFWMGRTAFSPSSPLVSSREALPSFPLAWLPLQNHPGVLLITYPGPHIFAPEEQRILEMFTSRCAALLEQAQKLSELRQAYERQKELDQLKDQFLVIASHELRTPLTAIQGYIELLHDYNTTLAPDLRSTFITKARNGCDELALLVDNIMSASHIQSDVEKARLQALPLRTPLAHALETFEAINRREKRAMTLIADSDLVVLADPAHLHQILLNLLGNALKYSSPGTNIIINATGDECSVTVGIHDFGLGIPLDMQEQLFDRFTRLERDMNSPVRGAGLGLFICRRLVEAMGGKIWVESQGRQGEGSSFYFSLPRVTV